MGCEYLTVSYFTSASVYAASHGHLLIIVFEEKTEATTVIVVIKLQKVELKLTRDTS